jgi:hypothetical protein
MKTYNFHIDIQDCGIFDEDYVAAKLAKAQCFDSLITYNNMVCRIQFSREHDSFWGAIESAVEDLRGVGLTPTNVGWRLADNEI